VSFAIWNQKPPFDEASLTPGEKIYQVGDFWVVSDNPNHTQADVDAVLNPAPPPLDLINELRTALMNDPALLDRIKLLK
jgi:hypothetical protein